MSKEQKQMFLLFCSQIKLKLGDLTKDKMMIDQITHVVGWWFPPKCITLHKITDKSLIILRNEIPLLYPSLGKFGK